MSLDIVITDGSGSNGSAKTHKRDGESGLVVYTKDRYVPKPKSLLFLNETYGQAMNQDGGFSGTPVEVHDGLDNTYWTGSNISGTKVTFNSTDRFNNGAQSVKVDNPSSNDVWQFDKGSTQDLTGYVAITMAINIDKDWGVGDSVSIYGWDTNTNSIVGTSVLLEDYMEEFDFDVWQNLVIPLEDMGLLGDTIYAFRMEQVSTEGKGPKFYTDDFQIEQLGDPIEYRTNHTVDIDHHIESIIITLVDAIAGTLVNGAGMLPLSYNQLLGVSALSNGVQIRSVKGGVVQFSATLTRLIDFLGVGFEITNAGSDGTNTFITLKQDFPTPLVLSGSPEFNYVSITIQDDLTGLLEFSAKSRGVDINGD